MKLARENKNRDDKGGKNNQRRQPSGYSPDDADPEVIKASWDGFDILGFISGSDRVVGLHDTTLHDAQATDRAENQVAREAIDRLPKVQGRQPGGPSRSVLRGKLSKKGKQGELQ